MQILKPIVHETIWGGSKLTPYSGSECRSIGHLYAFIDSSEMTNEIVSGADAGKTIHQWFLENRARYGLQRFDRLPITAALVEAQENLSIQVHPDDARAAALEGVAFGKNESFYTLEAPTTGRMYNGCLAGTVDEVKRKLKDGRVMETVDEISCQTGDYIFIEGGTLHAATAGSLHFEIEENCELTYRLHDFDRVDASGARRALQVEKALHCIDVEKKSFARKYAGVPIEERRYATQLVSGRASFTNERNMFAFAVMIKGGRQYAGTRVLPGTAILLSPNEVLDTASSEFIIAWPKPLDA